MIEVQGHGYYRTLREKLGWGGKMPGVVEAEDGRFTRPNDEGLMTNE
jgi:hypothetical protein